MPTIKRLQGADFANECLKLKLIAYLESHRGNICGYYAYPGRKTLSVSHWMNNDEIIDFNYDGRKAYKLESPFDAKYLIITNDGVVIRPHKNRPKSHESDHKQAEKENIFNSLFPDT